MKITSEEFDKAQKAEGTPIKASAPRGTSSGDEFKDVEPTGTIKTRNADGKNGKLKFYAVQGTVKGRVYDIQIMPDDLEMIIDKEATVDAVAFDVTLSSGKTIVMLEVAGYTVK